MTDKVNNTLFILFRRGQSKYIQSLLKKGEIYINTIDFIRNCDNNKERSDPNDSMLEREYLGDVKIKMCDIGLDINQKEILLNGENGVINTDSTIKGNIYCFTGIYTKDLLEEREVVEFDTKSFGESIIVIINPREFIRRFENAVKEKGYKYIKYAPVEYFPNNYSGNVGFFKKHQHFEPQNEFRFFIPNQENEPIKFEIGSIEDIAFVHDGCYLKFELSDNRIKIYKLPK